jgi:hypothetical protein
MSRDDDERLRQPGSRYEDDAPVAVAVIAEDASIDGSDAAHAPESTLWLPERLFLVLAAATCLGSLDICAQTRLSRDECRALCEQLAEFAAATIEPDIRAAALLVRDRAQCVVDSPRGRVLLVEGP